MVRRLEGLHKEHWSRLGRRHMMRGVDLPDALFELLHTFTAIALNDGPRRSSFIDPAMYSPLRRRRLGIGPMLAVAPGRHPWARSQ